MQAPSTRAAARARAGLKLAGPHLAGLLLGGSLLAGCGTSPGAPGALASPGEAHGAGKIPYSIQAHVADACADEPDGSEDACGEGGHWDLEAIGVDVKRRLVKASRPVVVATIDTGVDPDHPDLQGALLPMLDFAGDDLFHQGTTTVSFARRDGNGHGTHVAGTIVSVAGRDVVRVLPIKTIGHVGTGNDDVIARGIRAAVDWVDPSNPGSRVRALNLSIGGRTISRALGDAIRLAASRGVVVIASSGNRGKGVDYPATLPETISVGATNLDDELAEYSNRGPQLTLAAPGGDGTRAVYSSWPTYLTASDLRKGVRRPHAHAWMVGTSMAAPHVTAAVAMLLAREPWLTPGQVRDRLAATAIDLGPAGPDPYFGAGLLAIDRALATWGADGL